MSRPVVLLINNAGEVAAMRERGQYSYINLGKNGMGWVAIHTYNCRDVESGIKLYESYAGNRYRFQKNIVIGSSCKSYCRQTGLIYIDPYQVDRRNSRKEDVNNG